MNSRGARARKRAIALLASALVLGLLTSIPGAFQPSRALVQPPGSPDSTFGRNGDGVSTQAAPGPAGTDLVRGVDTDSQNNVYGIVSDYGGETTLNIVRMTSDGTPDPSYDDDGYVTYPIVTAPDSVTGFDMAIDSQDRVVAAGNRTMSGSHQIVVARFLPDGSFDSTFNGGNPVVFNYGTTTNTLGRAVALDGNDDIYVVGEDDDGSGRQGRAAHITWTGQFDSSFGGDGVVSFRDYAPVAQSSYLEAVVATDQSSNTFLTTVGYADASGHSAPIVHAYLLPTGQDVAFPNFGIFDDFGSGGAYGRAISQTSDGRLVFIADTSTTTGSVVKIDLGGNKIAAFDGDGVRNLSGIRVIDVMATPTDVFVAGLFTDAGPPIQRKARIRALDADDGSDDTSYATAGEANFDILGASITDHTPWLTHDGQGRVIMGWSNYSAQTYSIGRLTPQTPVPAKSATKIYFNEDGALYAMASDGTNVVSLAGPPADVAYTHPVSDFAGDVVFQRSQTVAPFGTRIYAVNPADPANPSSVSDVFLAGDNANSPSLSVDGGEAIVGYIDASKGHCAVRQPLGGGYHNMTGGTTLPRVRPLECGFTDLALHPSDSNRFIAVQGGKLVTGRFGFDGLTQLSPDGWNVTQAKWGRDGTLAAFVFDQGAESHVAWVDMPDAPTPLPSVHVMWDPGPGFNQLQIAPSPDGADPSVLITALPFNVSNKFRLYKAPLDGGGGVLMRQHTLLGVGDWNRNFAAYTLGAVAYAPAAVPASSVPIQGGSPAAQHAPGADPNLVKAGLINLSLLKSGLINLSLLKSGLVNLSLLRSGLVSLSLLKSGLVNLSLLKSGEHPAKVEQGLDQITLAMIPIVKPSSTGDARGWRERIAALNSPKALELSKLALTQISLNDLLGLADLDSLAWPEATQLDLSNSAFGSLNVMSFLLNGTTLRQITIGRNWCDVLEALPDNGADNCGENYGGLDATLLALQIAGVNLDALDLDGNTANGPDLSALPYSAFQLDRDTSLLPDVQLASVNPKLNTATLGGLKVADLAGKNIVDCSAPAEFDCTAPGATLGAAHVANRILGTAAFGDLGDLGAAGDNMPMYEVILGLIGSPVDDPFNKSQSELGITPELGGEAPRFGVSFSRAGMGWGATRNPTVTVKMPEGFKFEAGSGLLDGVAVPDPIDAAEAGWVFNLNRSVTNLDVMNLSFGAYAVNPKAATAENYDETSISASIGDGSFKQTVGSDQFTVSDPYEIGDFAGCTSANTIDPDTLYFSRLEHREEGDLPDVDYFCVRPPAANSTMTVYLNQLPYDADLAVFHPADQAGPGSPLRAVERATPLVKPINDNDVKVYNGGEPVVADGEADIPLPAGLPIAGISNNDGTKAERVEAITWPASPPNDAGVGPMYIVQVSANNAHEITGTEKPYALRYTLTAPKTTPPGPARTQFSHTKSAASGPLPANLDTLILHAPSRFADLYPGAPANFASKLDALAAATNGVVFNVDSNQAVVDAFAAADATPGDPDVHNAVVRAINDAVDAYLGDRRDEVDDVIIVGTDEVIPFARLLDMTQTANEQTFVEELKAAASNAAPALIGSAVASRTLSDDPYGSFTPRAFGGTWLYVPDVALGRLVETPAQIGSVIDGFIASASDANGHGVLTPTKTLSVGSDFMTNMAESIRDAFAAQLPNATGDSLISNGWNRSDLEAKVAGQNTPNFLSLNSHFTPTFLIPASRSDENHVGDPDVQAGGLATLANFKDRLFATMGCHSGYSITNYLTGGGKPADFAEALSADGVAAFVGNTGYGIGLRSVDAFSQTLFKDFANFLGYGSFGDALTWAKQEYLANGVTNPYDYKVLQQAVYYGIPQYRIAGAQQLPPAPPGPHTVTDPISGLQVASITRSQPMSSAKWSSESSSDGKIWTWDDGGHAVAPHRPVQPSIRQELTKPGLDARSAWIKALRIGTEEAAFDPVLARPVVDDAAREPEIQFGDVLYPANVAEVANYGDGGKQRLNLVPAQFRATGLNAGGTLVGVERRYSLIGTEVFYLASGLASDTTPGELTDPQATQFGGVTEFSVRASDAESDISRVSVLYRRADGDHPDFTFGEMAQDPENPGLWRFSTQLDGPIEYLFQALNSQALTGSISNHGNLFDDVQRVEATGDADQVTVSTDKNPTNGFFDGDVKVTFASTLGLPITVTDQNGDPVGNPVTAHGEGPHAYFFESTSANPDIAGDRGVFSVNIDQAAPTVAIASPSHGATYAKDQVLVAHFTCTDLNLESCVAVDSNGDVVNDGDTIDTATDGNRTLTVRGRDLFGHETERHVDFEVSSVDVVSATVNGGPVADAYGEAVDVVIASNKPTATLTVTVKKNSAAPVTSTHTGSATIPLAASGKYTITYSSSRGASGQNEVKIDRDAPVVTITSPANGASVPLNDTTPPVYSCSDASLAACAVTTPMNTSTYGGPKDFTVTASDAFGRVTVKTHQYFVGYAVGTPCAGGLSHRFSNPKDAKVAVLPGGAFIVRFPLCDGNGVVPPSRVGHIGPPIEVPGGTPARGGCDKLLGLVRLCLPGVNPTDTEFNFRNNQWEFIQDSTGLAKGKHTFRVMVPDGTTMDYTVNVTLTP